MPGRRASLLVLAFGIASCVLAVGLVFVRNAGPATCSGGPPACVRILFVGNSYTSTNDLPGTFAALARDLGHPVDAGVVAVGGATLGALSSTAELGTALAPGRWDVVVLQEQSEVPASASARGSVMYPAVRALIARVEAAGARPVLFLTWAHRDGWPSGGLPDFTTMQAALDRGYELIANEAATPIIPVGPAWQNLRTAAPGVELWQPDGSHPTSAGTYLAACVLAAALLPGSPVGAGYTDGVPDSDAHTVQAVAAATVRSEIPHWHLP